MSAILRPFNEGGVFMYFILVLGIMAFGLILERTVGLYFSIKQAPGDFRKKLLDFIRSGDLRGAETFAASVAGNTSLGRIVEIGCHLRSTASGDEQMQARMDEALTAEISKIDRRTGFLAMYGNVATLLGLLGTITGMIHSFAAVSSASPADRALLLSRGIAEAMNCTAFGLIVAIPALVAFAVFQNKTDRMVAALIEATTQIYHDLLFFVESESVSRAAMRTVGTSTAASAPRLDA